MEKICQCGGEMIKAQLVSDLFGQGTMVRLEEKGNYKDFPVIPFVCRECGRVELFAGKSDDVNVFFGGFII